MGLDRIQSDDQTAVMADLTQVPSSFPRRLRRLSTIWTARGRSIFFVTFCTGQRQSWLDREEIHQAFRTFCRASPERAGVWVGRYVLMPDHLHVFVSAEGSRGLSKWVGAVKCHLAKVRREMDGRGAGGGAPAHKIGNSPPGAQPRPTMGSHGAKSREESAGGGAPAYNRKAQDLHRSSGRAWQDGFFDHVLRSGESYGEKWGYVRMNPVRAGLVGCAEDWPYAGEIEVLRW